MFVINQPSWAHVGNASLYRWLTGFVAGVYLAVWVTIGTLVQDPWRTGWMLAGIFGPLVFVAIGVPVWLICDRFSSRDRFP